jgi:hypothetical protein
MEYDDVMSGGASGGGTGGGGRAAVGWDWGVMGSSGQMGRRGWEIVFVVDVV